MDLEEPVDDEMASAESKERPLGLWRGRVTIHADFDDLPPEIAVAFGIPTSGKRVTAESPPPSRVPPAASD